MRYDEGHNEGPIDRITKGKWPPLTQLGPNTIFPEWLQEATEEMVKAFGDKFTGLYCEFSGVRQTDDNNYIARIGDISPMWRSPKETPSEDEQDKVPAMRKIMRLANNLAEIVPFELDDEAYINGAVEYIITREGFTFVAYDHDENAEKSAVARWNGKSWDYQEVVIVGAQPLSETQKAIIDKDIVINNIPSKIYGFDSWDFLERIEIIDEDDDQNEIALIFNRGQFLKFDEMLL